MLVRRVMGGAVGAALGVLALAPGAGAQTPGAGACSTPSLKGAECGQLQVPLDRATPDGSRITVAWTRFAARGGAEGRRGTVVFLAGGPGQSIVRQAASVANGSLRSLRRRYDLVFMDQRGTGFSSPLRCSTAPRGVFSTSGTAAERQAAVTRCGEELGDARRHYSTYETVLDLESLREALQVPKIIPLGVSYGGQVTGEYARRFPEAVQALVLDSTSPIEGIDALGDLPQLALPRVLREVCFPPGCARLLTDPERLLAAAVRRVGSRGLRGRVVLPGGRRRTARITLPDLYAMIQASDTDPALRTALPSALEAAASGDAAPLLRLTVGSGGGSAPSDQNDVRFLATACTEGRLPWAPTSDPSSRAPLLDQAVTAQPDRYAPFPAAVALAQQTATACLGWPSTERAPYTPSPEQGPDVPVLVLAGREDLRTPLEDQRRAAAQFPQARVIPIPNVGHSTLGTDPTGCASRALTAFLLATKRAACPTSPRPVPLAMPVFRGLSDLPGIPGRAPRRVERTVAAVDLTLRDVVRQLAALSVGTTAGAGDVEDRVIRIGGLRGGRLELRRRAVTLVGYEIVTGVRVSGTITPRGTGTLVVSGTGAKGTLRLLRSGTLRGALDGFSLRYRPAG